MRGSASSLGSAHATLCFSGRTASVQGLATAGAFLCTLTVVAAQGEHQSRTELLDRIDAVVVQAMANGPIAGTSVGIGLGDEIVVAKGYGYSDLENDVRATEHTVYRIGSLTKQFTAAAIMMLIERGDLHLDDELTQFLPDYPTQGHRVTVRHLLNHTSGIKSMTDTDLGADWRRLDGAPDEVIGRFSTEPFNFSPGEEFRYNNSGYYLLGAVIERVSGDTYADFLWDQMWRPLGMRETHYLYNSPIIRNRAEGYKVNEGELLNADPLSMHIPYAAGALGSSVVDLLMWERALREHRVLSPESYKAMVTPETLNNGETLSYGYGLGVGRFEEHPAIIHAGGINGFSTILSHYPDDALSIVVLCNTQTNASEIERALARVMLGMPEPK